MSDSEFEEIEAHSQRASDKVISFVFRQQLGLDREHLAVPSEWFRQAAKKAGIAPKTVMLRLKERDEFDRVQLAGNDGHPVHCWHRVVEGVPKPTNYVPRPEATVVLPGGTTKSGIRPDGAYRFRGRIAYGSVWIREYRDRQKNGE